MLNLEEFMKASEAYHKRVGFVKCPMCQAKEPEVHFQLGELSNLPFRAIGYICPKCGYVMSFDLRKLLAE